MNLDISKFVYREENSDAFFVDTEDYTEESQHLQGYEDGDMVKWMWDNEKYFGTLRNYGTVNSGVFVIFDAKKL